MHEKAKAVFRNGHVELASVVDWPEGTLLQVSPVKPELAKPTPMIDWPERFFEKLNEQWGDEPFERPPQGTSETREDWSD